jgi:hypothetical protein
MDDPTEGTLAWGAEVPASRPFSVLIAELGYGGVA